ncbi:MAG: DsbA family protein [archaeon]
MQKNYIFLILLMLLISCTSLNKDEKNNTNIIQINLTIAHVEHTLGDPNATIGIIEYSDFECPYSKLFYNEILPLLKIEYIATGKAKLIFRHLPLNSVHQNAHKAAEACECAGIQGKFLEMHDKMFEKGVSNGTESFKEYAKELNLSIESFTSCLDGNITRQNVIDDFYSGVNSGVTGTPAFFINGKLAPSLKNYEEFSEFLNKN